MNQLSGIVSRCASFACIGQEWARRKYDEQWFGVLESLTTEQLIRELATIFNGISGLQAATLYEVCLCDSEVAVLAAGDVMVYTPAANESYMERFMSHYYNIIYSMMQADDYASNRSLQENAGPSNDITYNMRLALRQSRRQIRRENADGGRTSPEGDDSDYENEVRNNVTTLSPRKRKSRDGAGRSGIEKKMKNDTSMRIGIAHALENGRHFQNVDNPRVTGRRLSGWISIQVSRYPNFYPPSYDDIIGAYDSMRGNPEE